jgi:NADH-quinone oxidoreductase subunit C
VTDPWQADLPGMIHDLAESGVAGPETFQVEGSSLRLENPEILPAVLVFLREDSRHRYRQLVDVCGVDYGPGAQRSAGRFDVVYHLLGVHHNRRVRLKTGVSDGGSVPTASRVFAAAGWWEREVFDMYGVPFAGHPDLRRILTDEGFEGYPLRKDFPLSGFYQVRYDPRARNVVREPVQLDQPFRDFSHVSPWKGDPDRHMRSS